MNWASVRLGELIDVKHGFAFSGEFFTDSGDFVLLTPGNCYETGGLKLRPDKEKFFSGEFPDEYLLHKGDLLIVMTDLVGSAPVLGGAFMIPEDGRYLHNQRLGLVTVTDESRLDKGFLYWLLNSHDYRGQIRGSASGATVRHTSPGRVKNVSVRIPSDVTYQRDLAMSLFAYDDLIDNNRRRIKLLEDSVRLLFDEWFVRLRYPGHALDTAVDGVPLGWTRAPLGASVVLRYGKALKAEDRAADGEVPVYGSSGVVGTHDKAMVPGPAIIVGRKGNVGSVFWCTRDFWPIDTVYFVDAQTSDLYLYYALQSMHFISTDVAVPGLNRDFAYSRPLLSPPAELRARFLEAAGPIHAQIDTLAAMNDKLRAARDLLLPRLMSGELTV